MEDTLVAGIQFSLNNYLHDNALFLAERLQACVKNETSLYHLGTVYLQMGKIAKVRTHLKFYFAPILFKFIFARYRQILLFNLYCIIARNIYILFELSIKIFFLIWIAGLRSFEGRTIRRK